jgi:hypothetical protein
MKISYFFGWIFPLLLDAYVMIPSHIQGVWKLHNTNHNMMYKNIRFNITPQDEIRGYFGKGIARMKIRNSRIHQEDNEITKMEMTLHHLEFLKYPSFTDYSNIMKGIRYIYIIQKKGILLHIKVYKKQTKQMLVSFEIPDTLLDSFLLTFDDSQEKDESITSLS